jgi:hypothetical protein
MGYWQIGVVLFVVTLAAVVPQASLGHRSGCHNLHTCPSDTGSYACGDLGYPCAGATSIGDVSPTAINVPLAVEAVFKETFDRVPTDAESAYWKKRLRSDKDSVYKLRRAMAWHKANGSFGPAVEVMVSAGLVQKVNALFRSVHDGRSPTVLENQYWISRIADKPSEVALRGAMAWHRLHRVNR